MLCFPYLQYSKTVLMKANVAELATMTFFSTYFYSYTALFLV